MTPTEFRDHYNEWRKTAPANDSDIIPPMPRHSASPRHKDVSSELGGVLFWQRLAKPVQLLATNWMMPADNDNEADDEEDDEAREPTLVECEHVTRPEPGEIMSGLVGVELEMRHGRSVPLPGPLVEYGPEEVFSWKSKKTGLTLTGTTRAVARLGSLRFCTVDCENAKRSPTRGSLITHKGYRVKDEFGAPLGGDEKDEEAREQSNRYFAALFNAKPHRYITGGRLKSGPKSKSPFPPLPPVTMSVNEARAFCGLSPAVPTNDNRPALPCGSRDVSELFLGNRVAPDSTHQRYEYDPTEWLTRPEQSAALRSKLSSEDVTALDTAICAANFAEVGQAFGYEGKTAERQGKSRLIAANRNLSTILQAEAASASLFAVSGRT